MLPKISDTIVNKWEPIIRPMGFKEKDIKKVCGYCEWHSQKEIELANFSIEGGGESSPKNFKTTLPLSIHALKKLSSLDNIQFTPHPAFMDMVVSEDVEGLKAEGIARTVKAFRINVKFANFFD